MQQSGEIRLENVVKRFGETVAVKGVSLVIPHGAYCCLLGPSGCGKTTILRMIAGHEDPPRGASWSAARPWPACRPRAAGRR